VHRCDPLVIREDGLPPNKPSPRSESTTDEGISVTGGERKGHDFDRAGIPRRKVYPDPSESTTDEDISVTERGRRKHSFDRDGIPRRKVPVPVPRRRNPDEEALEAGLAELSRGMKAQFDRRREPILEDSDESSDPLEGSQSGSRDNSSELNGESRRPRSPPASNKSNSSVNQDLHTITGEQHGKTSVSDQPYIAVDNSQTK